MNSLKTLDLVAYWWVKIACYLALLMPFVFLPWTIYPYIFGKTVFLVSVLMTALPWYIFLMIRRPEYRPKKSLIMYGLGVYALVMLLATIFSIDPNRSFWSYPERMTGFWPLLHYFLFFFMAISVFRGWKEWKKLLGFSIGVSVAVCFVAFIQKVSPEAVLQSTGARAGSFLNNPIFLAAYLLFSMFFTVLLLQKSERWSSRLMWGGILLVQLLAFLFAETRGALIGLYLAVLLFLLLYTILHKNKKIKLICLVIILLIVLATAGIWFARDQEWMKGVPGLNRFYNFSFTGGTIETRLIAWDIAIKGFQEKPVFGWGPENYFYAFNKHYNPRSLEFSFYETWFDHAHNQMLDQLNNTGIVGTLGYIAFFTLIIWQLIVMKKKGIMDLTVFAVSIAIFTAYFFQNLFIFDQPSNLLMLYLCLAWWQSYTPEKTAPAQEEPGPRVLIKDYTQAVIVISLLVLISLVYWYLLIFRPAFASTWVRNGVMLSKVNIKASSEAFESGVRIKNQYPDLVPLYYAREIAAYSRGAQQADEYLVSRYERVYELMDGIAPLHPANIYNYYLMSLVQMEWANADPTHLDQAMIDIEKALEYSPKRQQLRYIKGKIYLLQGKNQESINYYQETVALDPNISESWWNLGIAQYQAGLVDEAIASFNKSMEIGAHPANIAEVMALIDVFSRKRDLYMVIQLYEKAIFYEPNNARLYAALAAGYLEAGEYDKAREMANMAKQLEPSISAETDTFLQMIDFREMEAMSATSTGE